MQSLPHLLARETGVRISQMLFPAARKLFFDIVTDRLGAADFAIVFRHIARAILR